MRTFKTICLLAISLFLFVFAASNLFAQPTSFGKSDKNRKNATKIEQPVQNEEAVAPIAEEEDVRPSRSQETEINTITMIDSDEIKIIINKRGEKAFQLTHLDILWGTRAAMSGVIALILILIVSLSPSETKQAVVARGFITGCALMLSFYPFGISFMIMEWNTQYGIASMFGGALLTILTLVTANRLRKKSAAIIESENMANMPEPDMIYKPQQNTASNPINNPPPPPSL